MNHFCGRVDHWSRLQLEVYLVVLREYRQARNKL